MCKSCFEYNDHGMVKCRDGSIWDRTRNSYTRGINRYGCKPVPYLFPTKNDERNPHHLFYGIELEVQAKDLESGDDTMEECRDEVCEDVNSILGITYGKSDISIDNACHNDGIEFVSHPASMNWYTENKAKFAEAMVYLRKRGYTSHTGEKCGLHVHVSSFPLEYETDHGIEKILWFFNRYQENMTKFSRRNKVKLERWARFPDFYVDESTVYETMKQVKESVKDPDAYRARYRAVNLQNEHTVEFRLIRGTLNIESFMAALQLFSNLCETVMTTTFDEFRKLDWDYFIGLNNYSELQNYWASRELVSADADALEKLDRDDQTCPGQGLYAELTKPDAGEDFRDVEAESPVDVYEFAERYAAGVSANESGERNIVDNTFDPAVTPGVPTDDVLHSRNAWERVTLAAAEVANAVPSVPPHVEQRMRELFQQYRETNRGVPNVDTVIDCMSAATVGA